MTEFNLDNHNSISDRQFDLCVTDGDDNVCNGDWISVSNSCGTVTDNGDFILANDSGYIFKLGTCGLDKIQNIQLDQWHGGQICQKIPGGAIFCAGKKCFKYIDTTETLVALPDLNDWHSEGNIAYSNGQIRVIGGTQSDPENYYIEILSQDESEWIGADFYPGVDFPEREFKGFTVAVNQEGNMYTFNGFGIDSNGNYSLVDDYVITTRYDWQGKPSLYTGWVDVTNSPVMEWEYETTMYDNFVSHIFNDKLVHAQPVFCDSDDPTQSGSLYNWAQAAGIDLEFLDANGVFDKCIPNTSGYTPNYFELELRYYDKGSKTWLGPYLYWSKVPLIRLDSIRCTFRHVTLVLIMETCTECFGMN